MLAAGHDHLLEQVKVKKVVLVTSEKVLAEEWMAVAPAGAAVPVLAVPLDLWGTLLLRWDTGGGYTLTAISPPPLLAAASTAHLPAAAALALAAGLCSSLRPANIPAGTGFQ